MTASPSVRAETRRRRHAETEANGGIAPTERHNRSTYAEWRCRCDTCINTNRSFQVGRAAVLRVRPVGDTTWLPDAPCADMAGQFDLPIDYSPMQVTLWARTPLAVCAGCPFRQECITLVNPRNSEFDGAAGGIVWRQGKPVRMLEPRPPAQPLPGRELLPCGTRAAYTRHQRRGDPIDDACRRANTAYRNMLDQRRAATETQRKVS